jgi:HSP20 family protein
MTVITRFNPINDLRTLQARMLEPFFGRLAFADDDRSAGTWAPPVDVAEETDRILVKVEVPGMNEADLKVHFEDGTLSVSGERQFERRDDRNYHRIERSYGSFIRTFSVPGTVDPNGITANYRNGVLEIEMPKREESKPKQIAINIGTDKQLR